MSKVYSSSLLKHHTNKSESGNFDSRLRFVVVAVYIIALLIGVRLFFLMVYQHEFYLSLASGTQEVVAELTPERGQVFIQDTRTSEEFPLAINRDYYSIVADTKTESARIPDQETAKHIAETLAQILQYDDIKKDELIAKLSQENKVYILIEKKIDQKTRDTIAAHNFPGLHLIPKPYRYYPEGKTGAHVIGFLGYDEEKGEVGRYGIEGYWQNELAGSPGEISTVQSAIGRILPLAGRTVKPAEDGSDLLLTIDRTLQYFACDRLERAVVEYEAVSGSLIIMDPKTGAIRSMCSVPTFDPNDYGKVTSIDVYNNTAIFTPYEIGSIFKPITMAAAINEEVVKPDTYFYDSGSKDGVCQHPITNAGKVVFKDTTMTGVLEKSINTGMVQVVTLLGKHPFRDYLERFGFGVKEGLELDSEQTGVISSLYINKKDQIDCYTATASFGQGITATPLQMAVAYSAIANGGILMKPYIVEEVRKPSGKVEKTKPTEVRRVLSGKASALVGAMLVSVVDNGYDGAAHIDGYFVAGKTGTAQIAGRGGYTSETNHSFAGFAPVDDPKFTMVIKLEKPKRQYASYTVAPVFGEIAKFALDYYQIPPSR